MVVLLTGCTHWEPYPVPTSHVAARLPTLLRAWTPDREATVLADPLVHADTLYGRSRGDTLGMPLSAIQRLERQRLEVGRTVVVVVGSVALLTTVSLLGGGLE